MRKLTITITLLFLTMSLWLVACGPDAGTGITEPPAAPADTTETTTETEAETEEVDVVVETEMVEGGDEEDILVAPDTSPPSGDRTLVRWFVGLGTGQNAEQVAAQQAVVEAFNASQDEIELRIEIIQNEVAYDTLATVIASGNAPDIVGPVGVRGSNAFTGNWLDLEPVIQSTGYDLNQFPEATVDFYRVEGEGLIGLPFGVFPSFIYYNRALFDEAGLDYPPHSYGEPYADGDPWNYDKLAELARILTVDANGNDATDPDFDATDIIQFGFINQWTDARGAASQFGAGNFVDEEGNAYVPDHWREGFHWIYNAIWQDRFMPNQAYEDSELLSTPNAFASGNVAMAQTHLWFTCCLGEMNAEWDIAAMPTYNGEPTAKLHADTFRILNNTQNPEAAFTVLAYLVGEGSLPLLQVYGGMPARPDETDAFFAGLEETYPHGVDWQVVLDSLNYPDNPSHEANMPNFNRADERIGVFYSLMLSNGSLDIDAELDNLVRDLQALFDSAP